VPRGTEGVVIGNWQITGGKGYGIEVKWRGFLMITSLTDSPRRLRDGVERDMNGKKTGGLYNTHDVVKKFIHELPVGTEFTSRDIAKKTQQNDNGCGMLHERIYRFGN